MWTKKLRVWGQFLRKKCGGDRRRQSFGKKKEKPAGRRPLGRWKIKSKKEVRGKFEVTRKRENRGGQKAEISL